MVTAKMIAEALGISPTAVSLALNGKAGVSEKTRTAVLETAQRMGYKSLRPVAEPTATKTLCFMTLTGPINKHSPFSTYVLEGIERIAAAEGYNTLIRYLYEDHIFDEANMTLLNQIDGLILLGTDITSANAFQILDYFAASGDMPKIVLDNMLLAGQVDCISNDNYGGARLAIAHLVEQGCNSLGYLRSRTRVSTFAERERGICETLADAGFGEPLMVNLDISYEKAYQDMLSWLDTNPKLPDGFFAENDVLAAAAIRALKEHGISVPEQVSMVGFDDVPIAQMTDPQITSIKSFMDDLGELAANLLFTRLRQVEQGNPTKSYLQTYVSTQLVERNTVATP
ncbi:MAG: LacI family DNA-binding transcriptional regulator, partial [Eubacteriales bacterium]